MPSLNLRDEQLRAAAGLLVPEQPPTKPRDKYHRPRHEMEQLIIEAVYSAKYPLSRSEIAAAVRRKKSRHLTEIVQSLVKRGVLIEQALPYNKRHPVYIYYPAN